jgi:hypothetical protein
VKVTLDGDARVISLAGEVVADLEPLVPTAAFSVTARAGDLDREPRERPARRGEGEGEGKRAADCVFLTRAGDFERARELAAEADTNLPLTERPGDFKRERERAKLAKTLASPPHKREAERGMLWERIKIRDSVYVQVCVSECASACACA